MTNQNDSKLNELRRALALGVLLAGGMSTLALQGCDDDDDLGDKIEEAGDEIEDAVD